ncbi:MAG TPA: RNA polymerase-binding protein RbpA [Microbacteriaceae bacterium]|nr:RNA polymerase-binding protein RbpA [Microbacteriaceae bacterium]
MAERHLRGARIGNSSLQREDGIALSARQEIAFRCVACGNTTILVFAIDAELPDSWECRTCGKPAARLDDDDQPVAIAESEEPTVGRTPWEMLLERRSIPELEIILQERLDWLRSRRGELLDDQ